MVDSAIIARASYNAVQCTETRPCPLESIDTHDRMIEGETMETEKTCSICGSIKRVTANGYVYCTVCNNSV